jgi:hypothetical protein
LRVMNSTLGAIALTARGGRVRASVSFQSETVGLWVFGGGAGGGSFETSCIAKVKTKKRQVPEPAPKLERMRAIVIPSGITPHNTPSLTRNESLASAMARAVQDDS